MISKFMGVDPSTGRRTPQPECMEEVAREEEGELRAGNTEAGQWVGPVRGSPLDPFTEQAYGVAQRASGLAVVGLGTTVLVGWATGFRILTTGLPGSIPMVPNTAVAFVVLGAGLWLLAHKGGRFPGRLVAGAGAAAVTLICAVRLSEYATGIDLAVDWLFFQGSSELVGLAPVGQMALLISGVTMLMLMAQRETGPSRHVTGILGALVFGAGSVFGLSYLFDAPYYSRGSSIPMSFFGAMGLILLGSGSMIAAGPNVLPLGPLLGSSIQSRLLRVFLPLCVSAVFLVTLLTHAVTRLAGVTFLAMFSALGLVGALFVTSLVCAWIANRVAEELRMGEEALQKAHDNLEGQVALRTLDLRLANAQLLELATTDGLTDLKNSRFFREALASAFSFATRFRLPLSVILLDVDQFKSYNDTFGHPAGDDALRIMSRLLLGNVRDHDVVARYGGEEFAVLLLGADDQVGRALAQRLLLAIQEANWPLRPITASLGVASITPDTTRAFALIERADRALYHSKRSGRNRITHCDDVAVA